MSGKFNGFSQDDINKLSGKIAAPSKARAIAAGAGIRRLQDNKKQLKINTLPVQTRPSAPDQKSADEATDTSINSIQDAIHFRPLTVVNNNSKEEKLASDESILHHVISNDRLENSPFKGISLKDFETQRKRVEEQNKQKKEMLYKAIEQHSEKTLAEVKKIHDIKAELSKLDTDLATDVSILRKQIEDACIQYSNIQKHYQIIEKEFLKVKHDLNRASEKKELLTEHLCTIIAHNEDRKAKKLTALMEKVGLHPNGEVHQIPGSI